MQDLPMYGDLAAGVLYTAAYKTIYAGMPPHLIAICMMEAWRQMQNDDRTHRIRKIVVPINEELLPANEFKSALPSLNDIRPTDKSEWRTLSDTENSPMFTNITGTIIGQTITEAATRYRETFVRPFQNRSPAEVKWVRLLLPASGKVKRNLPIEAVEFSFKEPAR